MRQTEQGDLWFFAAPILRAPLSILHRLHEPDELLDYVAFGPADGLKGKDASAGQPLSTVTPDGKFWIATTQGLAMFDLPRLPRTDQKPAIYVREIMVGRNQQPPGHELVLPPGTHHLELQFDAVEFSSPEKIRLQYRLDGVDSEWLDAPFPAHAIYTKMPPGKHAFHIRACNCEGIWDRVAVACTSLMSPVRACTIPRSQRRASPRSAGFLSRESPIPLQDPGRRQRECLSTAARVQLLHRTGLALRRAHCARISRTKPAA